MPTTAEIRERSLELKAALSDIMNDKSITEAQRAEKLDAFQKDYDEHQTVIKSSERASEMRAKLGGSPEGSPEETADAVHKALGGGYAAEILAHEAYAVAQKAVGGPSGSLARTNFSRSFEIGRASTKDATAANNVMGEALYGATGPTPLGQNPFLTGAAGPAILPHFVPGVVDQRFYPLTIESLFSSSTTESPAISYLIESLYVNNAAETAEGGQYPYSSDEWTRAYEQIGKITNALKVTDETLQDAPQFASFVQGRLVAGIGRKKEVALLAGNGAPGVNGLLARSAGFTKVGAGTTVSNVQFPPSGAPGAGALPTTVASLTYGRTITGASGVGPTAGQIAEGIFSGLTDIHYNSFVNPNAIVCSPQDWETIRLGKDDNGQYLGGSYFGSNYGVSANAGETLWGKRVVVTPALPAGTILIGSFESDVANIFRRSGLSVEMSNSNGNDFDHGLVTVRAEERLGLAVYRPAAFQLIQLKDGA